MQANNDTKPSLPILDEKQLILLNAIKAKHFSGVNFFWSKVKTLVDRSKEKELSKEEELPKEDELPKVKLHFAPMKSREINNQTYFQFALAQPLENVAEEGISGTELAERMEKNKEAKAIAQYLLQVGKNQQDFLFHSDDNDRTTLWHAAHKGYLEILKELMHIAKENTNEFDFEEAHSSSSSYTPNPKPVSYRIWLKSDAHGNSLLHAATAKDQFDVIKFILEEIRQSGGIEGVLEELNYRNHSGQTPLHLAKSLKMQVLLMCRGADPELRDYQNNKVATSFLGESYRINYLGRNGAFIGRKLSSDFLEPLKRIQEVKMILVATSIDQEKLVTHKNGARTVSSDHFFPIALMEMDAIRIWMANESPELLENVLNSLLIAKILNQTNDELNFLIEMCDAILDRQRILEAAPAAKKKNEILPLSHIILSKLHDESFEKQVIASKHIPNLPIALYFGMPLAIQDNLFKQELANVHKEQQLVPSQLTNKVFQYQRRVNDISLLTNLIFEWQLHESAITQGVGLEFSYTKSLTRIPASLMCLGLYVGIFGGLFFMILNKMITLNLPSSSGVRGGPYIQSDRDSSASSSNSDSAEAELFFAWGILAIAGICITIPTIGVLLNGVFSPAKIPTNNYNALIERTRSNVVENFVVRTAESNYFNVDYALSTKLLNGLNVFSNASKLTRQEALTQILYIKSSLIGIRDGVARYSYTANKGVSYVEKCLFAKPASYSGQESTDGNATLRPEWRPSHA